MLSPFGRERLLLQTISSGQGALFVVWSEAYSETQEELGGAGRRLTHWNSSLSLFDSSNHFRTAPSILVRDWAENPFSCIVYFVPPQLPIDLRGSVLKVCVCRLPTNYIVHPPFAPNPSPPPFVSRQDET